jgi:hypothetical protein
MNVCLNLWRSLAAVIFLCVALLSSFAADPTSPSENRLQFTNHLINEKSPYLLQHAHNPVDCYPWGEDAFAKARKENEPIFLSVGYSTRHLCHVMEHESYSDPEIAKRLSFSKMFTQSTARQQPTSAKISFVRYPPATWLLYPDCRISSNLRQPITAQNQMPAKNGGDRR